MNNIRTLMKKIWLKNPYIVYKRKKYIKNIRNKFDYRQKPTILSSNCIAGIIYHNLGLKFNSPTINLYIKGPDFVKFVSDLEKYIDSELIFVENHKNGYPICKLHDISIHFNHYESFEEAEEKWKKRINRIDFNNIYIITHINHLNDQDIELLSKVKCKKKILFTNQPRKDINFSYYLSKYKNHNLVGQYAIRGIDGFREFEKSFDYTEWLNN